MACLIVGCCYGRRLWEVAATELEAHDGDHVLPLPTHIYVRGADWAVEAVPPRVRRFDPVANPHPQVREYALDVPEGPYLMAWALAQRRVGELYNLAGLGACVLYEWTGLALPSLVRWRFCSQLAAEILREAGLPVLPGVPDTDITPARLEAWVVRSGGRLLLATGGGIARPAPPPAVHGGWSTVWRR